jgi:hypothetical protein
MTVRQGFATTSHGASRLAVHHPPVVMPPPPCPVAPRRFPCGRPALLPGRCPLLSVNLAVGQLHNHESVKHRLGDGFTPRGGVLCSVGCAGFASAPFCLLVYYHVCVCRARAGVLVCLPCRGGRLRQPLLQQGCLGGRGEEAVYAYRFGFGDKDEINREESAGVEEGSSPARVGVGAPARLACSAGLIDRGGERGRSGRAARPQGRSGPRGARAKSGAATAAATRPRVGPKKGGRN